MKKLIVFVLLAFLVAGCLKPVQKLGCCLKEYTDQGCMLYNTTDQDRPPLNLTAKTVPNSCDNPDMGTEGYCNVTLDDDEPKTYRLIPICSQDDLVSCVNPNCTTMVCGEFKFKPRFAPGMTSSDEDDMKDEGTPPDLDDEAAARFYKASCRFLPMDSDLRQIMKSSNSQINTFRVGVGESFDEYDQYRHYFPMSDRYCSASEPGDPVDRYMNYLDPANIETFDPINGITENCFDEDNVLPPFTHQDPVLETVDGELSGFESILVLPVVPEFHNYKFSQYITIDAWSSYYDDGDFYYYEDSEVNMEGLHKKIDKDFYRKQLSIAHASTIYDVDETGTTRAPYECELAGGNCWSGSCDNAFYNRGVLIEHEEGISEDERADVITDCIQTTDYNDNKRVICAPTKEVAISEEGEPPFREYAKVEVKISHIHAGLVKNDDRFKYKKLAKEEGEKAFKDYWYNFTNYMRPIWEGGTATSITGDPWEIINVPWEIDAYWIDKADCPHEYPGVDEEDEDADEDVFCTHLVSWEPSETNPISMMGMGPHAGGAVFFGKVEGEETPQPTYEGDTIIGYALAKEDEFEDSSLAKNCNLVEGEDYVVVDTGYPLEWNETGLLDVFGAYFNDAVKTYKAQGFKDGCGNRMVPFDAALASMPWVITYQKGYISSLNQDDYSNNLTPHMLVSKPSYVTRLRNTYDEVMLNYKETNSCNLRRENDLVNGMKEFYHILYVPRIILFKYSMGSNKIGSCTVDDATYLPKVRTFGWCEPCTQSTLAYQKITTDERVYMPEYLIDLHESPYQAEPLCEYDIEFNGSYFNRYDNVSCNHPYIPDLKDYTGPIGGKGSPRTEPEAAVLKQRMGDYLKSGAMPVIDLSDGSNWDLHNPDSEFPYFTLFYDPAPTNYSQYDFEALLGTMGAMVVVVDNVYGPDDIVNKIDRVFDRASLVKGKCAGCLTAFLVKDVDSVEQFNSTVRSMIPPSARHAIDLVAFEYEVSDHQDISQQGAQAVVEDMASYGRASLQTTSKPTMVIGFNVRDDDPYWTDENYSTLFDTIIVNQDELVQAGILGIIYSPARSDEDGPGVVTEIGLSPWTFGQKKEKFCSLQQSLQKMTATAPTSIFRQANAIEEIFCEPCSQFDLQMGVCKPIPGNDPMVCDDGSVCTIPEGAEESGTTWKCPQNVVSSDCPVCANMSGQVICTRTHANGTIEELPPVDLEDIDSEIWIDYIAGLSRPDKCCLYEENTETKYSFMQETYRMAINQPLVYPKAGLNDTDCGIGGSITDLGDTGSFCSINQLPLKNYMMECHYG
ncbi:hypothetical protein GF318_01280 [Candidatus Micrarchaeota archaeon]|nr:hypothetical protein [Candidatus Micrarchaeota archaeon]